MYNFKKLEITMIDGSKFFAFPEGEAGVIPVTHVSQSIGKGGHSLFLANTEDSVDSKQIFINANLIISVEGKV